MKAIDVAKYFLSLVDEDSGDSISNLKLQKLLYYAQGYYLALNNAPLFPERIVAWQHGPVVPAVYHSYKQHGNQPIPLERINPKEYPQDIKDFLNDVYKTIGQFSAWKLRNMTHAEPPWKNAAVGSVISQQSMKRHFVTLVS